MFQIPDRSQPQHAALRLGVRGEHLHGPAAAVPAHCGGGGLGGPRPRRLRSGEEVSPEVPSFLSPPLPLPHCGFD